MQVVEQLRELGFEFTIKEKGFKIRYPGGQPPPEALPLLEELKVNRQEALAYLQPRATGEQFPLNSPQPAAGAPEDPFMVLFQETLTELCQVAGDQGDGFTPWLERYRPGLAQRIDQAEDRLNELWDGNMSLFRGELRRYYALNEQAIKQFKKVVRA